MANRRSIFERLDKYDLTPFQKRVLRATYNIPKGQVRTYKQIARQVGRPHAYRAVGTALKLNPLPIAIPCHRVIKSDGSLGNYAGSAKGTSRKRELLKREGYQRA